MPSLRVTPVTTGLTLSFFAGSARVFAGRLVAPNGVSSAPSTKSCAISFAFSVAIANVVATPMGSVNALTQVPPAASSQPISSGDRQWYAAGRLVAGRLVAARLQPAQAHLAGARSLVRQTVVAHQRSAEPTRIESKSSRGL